MGRKKKPGILVPPPPPPPKATPVATVEEVVELVLADRPGARLPVFIEQVRPDYLVAWEMVGGEPTESFRISRTHGLRLDAPPGWPFWQLSPDDLHRFGRKPLD